MPTPPRTVKLPPVEQKREKEYAHTHNFFQAHDSLERRIFSVPFCHRGSTARLVSCGSSKYPARPQRAWMLPNSRYFYIIYCFVFLFVVCCLFPLFFSHSPLHRFSFLTSKCLTLYYRNSWMRSCSSARLVRLAFAPSVASSIHSALVGIFRCMISNADALFTSQF